MREIKFRAWDGKQMHDHVTPWRWDFVISNLWHKCEKSTGSGILGSGGDTAEMLVPAIRFKEIMQFTGLKENAFEEGNKEIYEGDIIEFIDGERLVVEWNDDKCQWQYSDGSPINSEDRYATHKMIVGNIFENPELLTAKPSTNG